MLGGHFLLEACSVEWSWLPDFLAFHPILWGQRELFSQKIQGQTTDNFFVHYRVYIERHLVRLSE